MKQSCGCSLSPPVIRRKRVVCAGRIFRAAAYFSDPSYNRVLDDLDRLVSAALSVTDSANERWLSAY